ncbi:hypothetical protein NVP1249A_17 [Vibrio phage 1.249.A._10N.261.55.B9]|uniref:Uncharacterized protein n=2 Tax=Autolykiviridae TaxID=2184034 RepID=A0A2I7RXG9_9VIRU|nr:hypothetical protein KMD63_gp17 [Vibrio phage 1.249.A._10N.261.55.B9]AUR98311.1 hypothetical protein NVP1249A_17 [Vibrio phage 1.249.A._10N.261.55.B9]AUR98333.1 hypothetical protein NVP1249B_17 [Vibrio phage 1.249.B._10N.261.55.B9]
MAMRDYKFTLVANVPRSLNVPGNFFGVIGASGSVEIQFDDGVFITRNEGMGGSVDYQRVTVKSPINQTVTLALGTGTVYDARATVNANINTVIQQSNTVSNVADVTIAATTAGIVVAANANRTELLIKNPSSNPSSVRIGDNVSTGAASGFELEPGESVIINTTAAVNAYNTGTVAQTISVVELEYI